MRNAAPPGARCAWPPPSNAGSLERPTWSGDSNALATITGVRTRHGSWLMADGIGRMVVLAISLQPLAMTIGCAQPKPPARPNILLVTIDTFRADRVGIGLTPAIDRLAAAGLRFTQARTAVPLTLPSHATIHTGLLPPAHGVRENGRVLADS